MPSLEPMLVDDTVEFGFNILLVNDEVGDEIKLPVTNKLPLKLLSDYLCNCKNYASESLQLIHNGEVLTTNDILTKTMSDLNIKEGYRLHFKGALLPPISIKFVDESGEVTTLQTNQNEPIGRILEDYITQQNCQLLLGHMMFQFKTYRGGYLSRLCEDSPTKLGLITGDIIYVIRRFVGDYKDDLDSLVSSIRDHCKDFVNVTPPRKLINQRVTHIHRGIECTIVDYAPSTIGVKTCPVWTVRDIDGEEYCFDKEVLIDAFKFQYSGEGVLNALMEYISGITNIYIAESKYLGEDDSYHDVMLAHLKIQQGFEQTIAFLVKTIGKIADEQLLASTAKLVRPIQTTLSKLQNMKSIMVESFHEVKVNKPTFEEGNYIFAKQCSKSDITTAPTWELGIIKSYKEYEDIDGYGPRRTYSILFDSGDLVQDIEDYQVILDKEYALSKHVKESEWKGVKHVYDKDSSDPWAREVGWYTVDIKMVKETFVHLSDALNAYDISQAQSKKADLKESDLNFPKDRASLFKALEDGNVDDRIKIMTLELCLMHTYEWVSDSRMKQICQAVIYWARLDRMYDLKFGFAWKEALGHSLDGNTASAIYCTYIFALILESRKQKIGIYQVCRFFISAKGDIDTFLHLVPTFRKAYNSATSSSADLTTYINSNRPDIAEQFMFIKCTNGYTTQIEVAERYAHFKEFLTEYAEDRGTSVKSLRVKYNGRMLFISSIGKKTLTDLGIKDDDTLEITIVQSTPTSTAATEPKQSPSPTSKKKKNKKHKKSKKKRTQSLVIQKTEVELKVEHSKLLGKMYEEAEPTFKEIRQRLNAMNLERTKPKQRTSPSKTIEPSVEVVDNPLGDDQLSGKAGKTQFIIQVGEVSNLYKTTKPSVAGRGKRQDDIMIDLHGLTAEEAVCRLDKQLPSWIETAMKGTYPFVIPVKIVCGGGSQILAEVVENWIKQNDQVANAPKNMY